MTAETEFEPAAGDLHGLPTNANHLNVKWVAGDIWFSFTQRGEGMSIHFAALPHERRRLPEAVEAFCRWIFSEYDWCRMILGVIGPKSVVRLANKCGFRPVSCNNGRTYMARCRDEFCR